MRRWIFSTFLMMSLVGGISQEPAKALQQTPAQAAKYDCTNIATVIQAEPGDNFISLFGANWEAVAACNRFTAIRDGRAITSPDLLVAGSWIQIPADTPLTPVVAARTQGLEQQRLALLNRLNHLQVDRLNANDRALAERCRVLLNDNIRFAPDEQLVAREVTYLEDLAPHPPQRVPGTLLMPVAAALCGLLLLVLVVVAMKKRQPSSALLQQRQAQAQEELARVCARTGIRFGP